LSLIAEQLKQISAAQININNFFIT